MKPLDQLTAKMIRTSFAGDEAGIPRSRMSAIATGSVVPTAQEIAKLARFNDSTIRVVVAWLSARSSERIKQVAVRAPAFLKELENLT